MNPALASADPEVRRLVRELAARVVGDRTDAAFLEPILRTQLTAEVNDFARMHRHDSSYGFKSPAEYVEFMQAAIGSMQQFGAQPQGEEPEPETEGLF